MTIENLAISPDGGMVAFQYMDMESRRRGLGLFEWQSGKLTPIPRLPGMPNMGTASFSPDGQRLLAMASVVTDGQVVNQLVSIDLATLRIAKLAEARRGSVQPGYQVLQPGTDNILLVLRGPGVRYHLKLLDPNTGAETTILEEKDGFWSLIASPYFVGQDEVIFQAISPVATHMRQAVLALVPRDTELITYRLKFGGYPEIILTDLTANKASPNERGISFVSASGDGKTLAFIARSRSEPYDERGAYNLEIFTLIDGALKQMTNLRSHMGYAEMSRDGSTVVFGAKRVREGPRWAGHDIYILDLRTGKVTPTSLVGALQQRSDFKLP